MKILVLYINTECFFKLQTEIWFSFRETECFITSFINRFIMMSAVTLHNVTLHVNLHHVTLCNVSLRNVTLHVTLHNVTLRNVTLCCDTLHNKRYSM